MIKRILELKDVGRFSSLKSANGNEGEFARVNIVYAPNACGKTTICDIFRSLSTRNPAYIIGRKRVGESTAPSIDFLSDTNAHLQFSNGRWMRMADHPSIHVYDQRFVNENVFIGGRIGPEQKHNVYSLALGQKAIELNKAVQDAGEKLKGATGSVSRCESVLMALIPEGQQIEAFRKVEKVDDVDAKITELKGRITADKTKKAKADQIRKHGLLQKITIPAVAKVDLERVLSATLDSAALTAEGKIKEHLARCADSKKISAEWIKQGHEAQKGALCPYCGQDMSQLDLFATYKVFFSGALKLQERQRNEVKQVFQVSLGTQAQDRIINLLKQNVSDCDWWSDACGLSVNLPLLNAEDVKDVYSRALDVSLSALGRKQENLTVGAALQESEIAVFDEVDAVITSIREYNDAIESANAKILEFQKSIEGIDVDKLIKELACLEYAKKRYEAKVVEAYQNYDGAVAFKQSAQSAKTQANEALKQESESVFDAFGLKINEILSAFGVDFTVESDGVNLRGGASGQLAIKIKANGTSAPVDCTSDAAVDPSRRSLFNTLSGGDCSALGLAFFLARLETDANLATSIVVIDDPYHDQDRSRQAQTISLLTRKANECSQFFLLSHNIEFAQMFMSDKGIARNEIRAFEIPQMGVSVELKHGGLPQLPSKSYETDYTELSDYVMRPERYQDRLKEVVGRIRPLLETYLRYKYPLAWGEKEWLGDMIGKIRNTVPDDIIYACNCLVSNLEDVNNYTQRFHHRVTGVSADVPDPRELITYVKRALEIVHHA